MMAKPFFKRMFEIVRGHEPELKRQADILKNECPLVLFWIAKSGHFGEPILTLDPVESARIEGKRQLYLELIALCEFPAEDVRKYFDDQNNGEKR